MKRLVALTAAIGLGVLGLAAAPAAQAAPDPHIPPVTWGVCPAGVQAYAARFHVTTIQCGRVDVPEDYAHPQGKKITLEESRVPHTGPGKAKGVVLVNPGGTGGSAVRALRPGCSGGVRWRSRPSPSSSRSTRALWGTAPRFSTATRTPSSRYWPPMC